MEYETIKITFKKENEHQMKANLCKIDDVNYWILEQTELDGYITRIMREVGIQNKKRR